MKNKTVISLIVSAAALVVLSMLVTLTEGNFLMLSKITKESLAGVTMIKSVGFSIAAMVIIVYDKRVWVKILFVILDSAMVFCLQFFEASMWVELGAFIYGPYTGLNLYFIGMIISEELRKVLLVNSLETSGKEVLEELAETRRNLRSEEDSNEKIRSMMQDILKRNLTNAKRGRGKNKESNIKRAEEELRKFNLV